MYPQANQPHDIEIQWLMKHESFTYSLCQFESTYRDQVVPWGSSKDVRILRPAYSPRAKAIPKQHRAKLNASKDPKKSLPTTRFRHHLAALLCASKKINLEATSFFYTIIRLASQAAASSKSISPPSVQWQSGHSHASTSNTEHMETLTSGTTLHGRPYTMANGNTSASVQVKN
jgi:hypothetical protein